ncbi:MULTISPECIES: GNAT family N-acetyltransferase [unclassified Pseudactinotalea]|uniref:GNAT family N-acetyltransferase n=1 Tax=unclassified Pseudactinotalea TaxID=2649176 RepID=UPI00128CA889|nr:MULTISPECIES: GNAT family N-acetyltransferase [unclassified Pseudactinotalea]MPV49425.1 GNAT family N-acetyltransferase [Pseudactinotalea sp. HY160]QGH69284.1 GNAT family N-acetyltransferase [Pseudactinotalea sp. HY158]
MTPAEPLAPLSVRAQAPAELAVPGSQWGLTWRGIGPDDAAALHALVEALEDWDRLPYRSSLEETSDRVGEQGPDSALNVLGGYDHAGQMRAFGLVRYAPDDEQSARVFLDGGVHPQYRRSGVGTALLEWELGRARQLLAGVDRPVRARIVANVEETTPDAAPMLLERGFEARRWYFDLQRDLAAPLPQIDLARNLETVPWTADLDEQVRQAHNESFSAHWASEPMSAERWHAERAFFAPEWSFLVLDRTSDRAQVVGYLLSGRYEQDWICQGWSEGYIDMLGVRPDWRNRQIATALVVRAMRAYAAAGIDFASVGLDTAQPDPNYGLFAALDFQAIHSSTMYSIEF